jgi:hypothetical protein
MHLSEKEALNFNRFDWLRFFLQKQTRHRSGAPQDRLHVTIVRTRRASRAWPGERTRGVQPMKSMMLALPAAVVKVLLEALGVGYIGNVR